jgi:hypothetical protein
MIGVLKIGVMEYWSIGMLGLTKTLQISILCACIIDEEKRHGSVDGRASDAAAGAGPA